MGAIQAATESLLFQGFKMPKYAINPFTGLIQIVPSTGSSSTEQSDDPVFVPQDELSTQWIVRSRAICPQPTIHVDQMGSEHFNPPIIVSTDWEYLSDTEIKITFGKPSSGFVILHKN